MKKFLCAALAATLALLTGCVVLSVYPFYTAKDLAYDPSVIGVWINSQSDAEIWKFEPGETNSYALTYTSGSDTNVMVACRFKLAGEYFLDLTSPDVANQIQPPPIPSHLLIRVSQTNGALRMAPLNYDWLTGVLTNNPRALRHYTVKGQSGEQSGQVVLTADTAELQRFVEQNLKTADAWKDSFELKRSGAAPK